MKIVMNHNLFKFDGDQIYGLKKENTDPLQQSVRVFSQILGSMIQPLSFNDDFGGGRLVDLIDIAEEQFRV